MLQQTSRLSASIRLDEDLAAKILFVGNEAKRFGLDNAELVMSYRQVSLADLLAVSMGYKQPPLSSRKFLLVQLIESAALLEHGRGTPTILNAFNKHLSEYSKL